MHADEVLTDKALVRRLLFQQFPEWARLQVRYVRSSGTDNDVFRIGPELVARLPRIHAASGQVTNEAHWLPRLAPHLPLAVPSRWPWDARVRATPSPGRCTSGSPVPMPAAV